MSVIVIVRVPVGHQRGVGVGVRLVWVTIC